MTEKPYIRGKIAFFSKDLWFGTTDADWSWNDYPEQLASPMAETVDEAETIVLRNCRQGKGFDYVILGSQKKIPTFFWNCELTIIDRTIPAIIYRKKFESLAKSNLLIENPEIEKYETELPHSEIKKFIDRLPLK